MTLLTPHGFAAAIGLTVRAAQFAYRRGAEGKSWKGQTLPIVELFDQRGGAGGKVLAINTDVASPALRVLLGLPETPVEVPFETHLKGRPTDDHFRLSADKQRILEPILCHPKGSHERAKAFVEVAAKQHRFGDKRRSFAVKTLQGWVLGLEVGGISALVAQSRSDVGKARVRVTRDWDSGCRLSDADKDQIKKELDRTAHGLKQKGRSDRNIIKLCAVDLQKMTCEAGALVPKSDLIRLCRLNAKWVMKYRSSGAVHQYDHDHKAFSDDHEFRLQRTLTRQPMEVLLGDVHPLDIRIADALQSTMSKLRTAAKKARQDGLTTVRVHIIGWMDGSSHYLWATPVVLGPGQGITQQDVARSLYEVFKCPFGGIPQTIVIDNGSEYKALLEAVARFCVMAELSQFRVVKCRPYSPEGKARIEGAFGIVEEYFLSALPGYIAGDRMKSPTKSKGKRIDPYPHGPLRLVQDIETAVAQFNGTAQDGQLAGLSPKKMLEAKMEQTEWRAQVFEEETFDLVFSYEERRDVRKGSITIGKHAYTGPVLMKLIGEKQVPFLVPMRDPEGSIILLRKDEMGKNVIHRLTCQTFDQMDRNGAVFKSQMVSLQKAELAQRRGMGDQNVDVQAMLSAAADMTPVVANAPDTWKMPILDKDGILSAPRTEEEAREAEDTANRAHIEEFLALERAGRGGAAAGTARPSCAT